MPGDGGKRNGGSDGSRTIRRALKALMRSWAHVRCSAVTPTTPAGLFAIWSDTAILPSPNLQSKSL